jgi:hypothetical protein
LIFRCSDDAALYGLDDAGKRITDTSKMFKELLLDGLLAGTHLSTADPALHYHLQEACCESTPDAISVGQTISNFSQEYTNTELDNGADGRCNPSAEISKAAFRADVAMASPLTSPHSKGGKGEPNSGPILEFFTKCGNNQEGKRASKYHEYSHNQLISLILHSENKIRSLKNQLIQEKENKQHFRKKYDAAKSIAVLKMGSIHKVKTAMFAAQHLVQQANVCKQTQSSTSASKTVQHSGGQCL